MPHSEDLPNPEIESVSPVSCIGRWSLCHGAMCEALTQPSGQ